MRTIRDASCGAPPAPASTDPGRAAACLARDEVPVVIDPAPPRTPNGMLPRPHAWETVSDSDAGLGVVMRCLQCGAVVRDRDAFERQEQRGCGPVRVVGPALMGLPLLTIEFDVAGLIPSSRPHRVVVQVTEDRQIVRAAVDGRSLDHPRDDLEDCGCLPFVLACVGRAISERASSPH